MGTHLKACLGSAWRAVAALALLLLPVAQAEDIDIFMANMNAGSATQPNIMIWLDNSANWSREAQQWPDNDGKQGRAEVIALQRVLADRVPANIGLGGQTGGGSSTGGYVRFGIRDMTVAANKTALNNILGHIADNIGDSREKVNDPEPSAAMVEMYRYFTSGSVFRGGYTDRQEPATNVDKSGNAGSPSNRNVTAYAQGLRAGFAIDPSNSARYLGPPSGSCGRNYLVMVINNSNGQVPVGFSSYDGTQFEGESITGTSDSYIDEWARFLYQSGISVYILDAYNRQQNPAYSRVLEKAANVAGGKYFPVRNQQQIEAAFKQIFAEINAVNATFATASLPISATNRSQNLNQVFIGMFRPDGEAEPRWMGNLKRYQLIRTSSGVDLGDMLGTNAINLQTGFVTECAASFWTTGSDDYWEDVYANELARSSCTVFPTVGSTVGSTWSDLPDGPAVEKGGVAEVLRKGNGTTSGGDPTWAVSRKLLTYSASSTTKLTTLTASVSGWPTTNGAALLKWVSGYDDPQEVRVGEITSRLYSEFTDTSSDDRTRPSIHGDVIHSRPLPVNYGEAGVTVYYGANDGMLRAVNADTGRERWAYVAPEHFGRFQRQHDNRPLVNYPNVDSSLNPLPRDYFFDGSLGLYQKADNSKVWIFASQRRGGRMLYGFNVTNPDQPELLWRLGCPNMTDDTGCTTGYEKMGQTWSLPSAAFLKGESTTVPFVVVGGGYDRCEDLNATTTSCTTSGRKGNVVYVIKADDGTRVAAFATGNGSVVADIAMSDVNGDGSVDFGYAATTAGEIYRIDFSNSEFVAQPKENWRIRRVGYTSGGYRKFLYAPALLRAGTKMYVALGSGDREHPLDSHYPYVNSVANRFYVLLDDILVPASSTEATAVNLDAMENYSVAADATCDDVGVTPTSGLAGWYMNLEGGRGEQVVTSPLIAGGMVTFNTNRALPASEYACSNPLGEARGYWVNLLNASGSIGVGTASCGGDRSSVFVGGGLMPSPTIASVMIDGKMETVAIGAAQRSGGSSSGIAPQQVKPAISSKRKTIYWRSNQAD
jgi:type IV pilus assembly protein PilY1